jgi:hypothetical protein
MPVKTYDLSRFDRLRARSNWSWSLLTESARYQDAVLSVIPGGSPYAA